MEDFGFVFSPEQYDAPGEEFFLDNSLAAMDYFKGFHEEHPDGILLFVFAKASNLETGALPLWLYVVLEDSVPTFFDFVPVFRMDDRGSLGDEFIYQFQIIDKETYFLWGNELYAADITSKGHFIIRAVRMIISCKDMENVYLLENDHSCDSVCPVELYSRSRHKFIGACWEIYDEQEENFFWYPICHDEARKLTQYKDEDILSYPIELGETVQIDGHMYKLAYDKDSDDAIFQKMEGVRIDARQKFAAIKRNNATLYPSRHRKTADGTVAQSLSFPSEKSSEKATSPSGGKNISFRTETAEEKPAANAQEADTGKKQGKCIAFHPRH